jgi:hypothetical protein
VLPEPFPTDRTARPDTRQETVCSGTLPSVRSALGLPHPEQVPRLEAGCWSAVMVHPLGGLFLRLDPGG